jgi:hypothetical protein
VLASAYELEDSQVADDASAVQAWAGTDGELLNLLDDRHGWTTESENAPYYLTALRQALNGGRADGHGPR